MKIIEPHRVKSREVKEEDLTRIKTETIGMHKIMSKPIGCYEGGYALAHCQITKEDPLRFFWDHENRQCIINPKIIRHNQVPVDREEGCLTYADGRPQAKVKRYHKMEVEYQLLNDFPKVHQESVSGTRAQIFQHEIDHFNGIYIYD